MPQIIDCAIFGVPHEEFGETVIAAVQYVVGETLTIEQIQAFLNGKLARFKWPKKLDLTKIAPNSYSRTPSMRLFLCGFKQGGHPQSR